MPAGYADATHDAADAMPPATPLIFYADTLMFAMASLFRYATMPPLAPYDAKAV